MENIIIKKFEKKFEVQAITLLLSEYSKSKEICEYVKASRKWKWQYYDNPYNPNDQPVLWIALVDNNLAGFIGTIPVIVNTPNGQEIASWGIDLIVDPKYRGMGIGKKLESAWQHTFPIALGKGATPKSDMIEQKIGFNFVDGLKTKYIPLSKTKYAIGLFQARQFRKSFKILLKSLYSTLPKSKVSKHTCLIENKPPVEFNTLWKKISSNYLFSIERNLNYLKWRFCSHPDIKYYFLSIISGNELVGCAIINFTNKPIKYGIVSDFFVMPDNTEIAKVLLKEIFKYCSVKKAVAVQIDYSSSNTQILNHIKSALTVDSRFIVYTGENEINHSINKIENWYLSRSDSDSER